MVFAILQQGILGDQITAEHLQKSYCLKKNQSLRFLGHSFRIITHHQPQGVIEKIAKQLAEFLSYLLYGYHSAQAAKKAWQLLCKRNFSNNSALNRFILRNLGRDADLSEKYKKQPIIPFSLTPTSHAKSVVKKDEILRGIDSFSGCDPIAFISENHAQLSLLEKSCPSFKQFFSVKEINNPVIEHAKGECFNGKKFIEDEKSQKTLKESTSQSSHISLKKANPSSPLEIVGAKNFSYAEILGLNAFTEELKNSQPETLVLASVKLNERGWEQLIKALPSNLQNIVIKNTFITPSMAEKLGTRLGELPINSFTIEIDYSHYCNPFHTQAGLRKLWKTFIQSNPPNLKCMSIPLYFSAGHEEWSLAAQAFYQALKNGNILPSNKVALNYEGGGEWGMEDWLQAAMVFHTKEVLSQFSKEQIDKLPDYAWVSYSSLITELSKIQSLPLLS